MSGYPEEGVFIRHDSCNDCGSSDGLGVFTDHTYCFVCTKHTKGTQEGEPTESHNKPAFDPVRGEYRALPKRGLTQESCEKWRYQIGETYDGTKVQIANYYNKDKRIVAQKLRDKDKGFKFLGDKKASTLFGQQLWQGKNGKKIVITEGELDAISVSQAQGHKWPVVSVPTGAQGAAKELAKQLEWLNSFEEIIIFFDQDQAGQDAAEKCAALFTPGKVKVVDCELNDASEYIQAGRTRDLVEAIWSAVEWRPGNVVLGQDTWERMVNRPEVRSFPYPADWVEMNQKAYGVRLGELDVWTSGSGMGKTQVFRELKLHLLDTTPHSIADIALEEPLEDTVEALCAARMSKRIHLPDVEYTTEELRASWETTAGTGRYHLYDAFGSMKGEDLYTQIRYFATAMDCKFFFLDHLSIMVSGYAAEGNERTVIDEIMTELKSLTVELGIWIGVIVHLRKVETKSKQTFETGLVPSLDDLRGSGSLKQLANGVFAVSRDQQSECAVAQNTSRLHALKVRYTGRTGPADYLKFDQETGRMTATTAPPDGDEFGFSSEDTDNF